METIFVRVISFISEGLKFNLNLDWQAHSQTNIANLNCWHIFIKNSFTCSSYIFQFASWEITWNSRLGSTINSSWSLPAYVCLFNLNLIFMYCLISIWCCRCNCWAIAKTYKVPRRCKSFIMTHYAIFLTRRRTYFSENLSVLLWCVCKRFSPLSYVPVRISYVCQRWLNVLNRIYALYSMRLKQLNNTEMRIKAQVIVP